MDKPVVNLVPAAHPTFDFITNKINPTFPTWEGVANAMDVFFRSGGGPIRQSIEERGAVLSEQFEMSDREVAEKIAERLIAELRDHGAPNFDGHVPRFLGDGYQRTARGETMKDKFMLEQGEMASRLQDALTGMGAYIRVKILELDDSVFLLLPQT